ncbi:diacylglycerol kinase, catalytic region (plasmid) [Leptolyngbya sp. NIES-3755]|nr:diacylglycerol kinase, catalytic region [Leptolyngbya sp. NIES-3755]
MLKRALLLVNPYARRGGQSASQVIETLQNLGFELINAYPSQPHLLSEVIRRYQHQVDMVIVGGGDGTLNAAAEGLVDTQLPFGILPLGTANDLAHTLGIPMTLNEACRVIANGQLQPIDLGWVNGQYFFNVASLGLSIQITQYLNRQFKRRWGILAYAIAALKTVWRIRPFSAEIDIDGKRTQIRTIQITVGNGHFYGGGMAVCNQATINDQRLHLLSFNVRYWWQLIPLIPALRQGRPLTRTGIHVCQCQEIDLYTRKSYAINTDGEITTHTPAQFRVIPKAVKVFLPQQPKAYKN